MTAKTKAKPQQKLNVYIRAMERRDIPKVVNWLTSGDFINNYLTDYPTNNLRLLKNQLLKEISLPKFIFSGIQLLIAEVNGEILVGFIQLKRIDWRNRHLDLQIYIPPEYRNTDIPLIITSQTYNYIFKELNMHKLYTFLTEKDTEKLKVYQSHQHEPEAVLYDYVYDGKVYHDLYVFGTYKRDILSSETHKQAD